MEVKNVLKEKVVWLERFKPTQEFFIDIKIGRKRWGQLLRNEKSPTISEMEMICKYFNIDVNLDFKRA